MTIKEKLREIKHMDIRIDTMLKQIEHERERIRTIEYVCDRVSGGGRTDLSSTVVRIDQYVKMLEKQIDVMVDKKREIRALIDELDHPYRDVIDLYYFESGSTWDQIAAKMHYDPRHVRRLHGYALSQLAVKAEERRHPCCR